MAFGVIGAETQEAVNALIARARSGGVIKLSEIENLAPYMTAEQYQFLLANVPKESVSGLPSKPAGSVWSPIASTGSSSGGGYGGGGGGGGGGGAPSATAGDFRLALSGRGFTDLGFDVSGYISEAVRGGKSVDWLIGRITSDSRFDAHFPGIKDDNGLLRQSPAQYRQQTQGYREIAANFGITLNRTQLGGAISSNLSADEFRTRMSAASVIRDNPGVRHFFKNYTGTDSFSDAFNFVLGKSDATVYSTYEAAVISDTAKDLGLKQSEANSLSLAGRTEGVLSTDEIERRYLNIASELRTADVELRNLGITQKELETIEFGGPNRAALLTKAELALNQRKATLNSTLAQQQGGIDRATGRPVTGTAKDPGY